MSHSFEFSIFFPEFSASPPPASLKFAAYLAHFCAGSFAFLDSDSPRQVLSIDAWVIRIGPVAAELFAFWSLSGFGTCRGDISGSKARNHYSFCILTACTLATPSYRALAIRFTVPPLCCTSPPPPLYLKFIYITAISPPFL